MRYYIDAYNLIGKKPDIKLSDKNKEDALIAYLKAYKFKSNDHIILVFDGHQKDCPWGSQNQDNNMRYIFTPNQESADHYIINALERENQPCKVITSDNEIIQACKHCNHAQHISCEAFLKSQNKKKFINDKPSRTSPQERDFWLKKWQQ
eukprot:COSAG01_NODE_3_length_63519_cov_1591.007663_26_plen_150_part_00